MQQKRLFTLFGILILSGIIAFAYFNSRQYFTGPQLTITSPENGAHFEDPFITIAGTAENTSFIRLNGNPVFVNEANQFEQQLLLSPGTSIMKLEATDRFDRRVERLFSVTYQGEPRLPTSSETTTATSSLSTLPLL